MNNFFYYYFINALRVNTSANTVVLLQFTKSKNVILYYDLSAFKKWSIKAVEIQKQCNCKVTISTLLEDEATYTDRASSLDIADYILLSNSNPPSP